MSRRDGREGARACTSERAREVRTDPREGQSGSCGLRSPRIASEFATLPPIPESGLPDRSPSAAEHLHTFCVNIEREHVLNGKHKGVNYTACVRQLMIYVRNALEQMMEIGESRHALWQPAEAKFNTPLGSDGQERVLTSENNLAGDTSLWLCSE